MDWKEVSGKLPAAKGRKRPRMELPGRSSSCPVFSVNRYIVSYIPEALNGYLENVNAEQRRWRSNSTFSREDFPAGLPQLEACAKTRKRLAPDDVRIRITGATFDRSESVYSQEEVGDCSITVDGCDVEDDKSRVASPAGRGRSPLREVGMLGVSPVRPRSFSAPSFDYIDDVTGMPEESMTPGTDSERDPTSPSEAFWPESPEKHDRGTLGSSQAMNRWVSSSILNDREENGKRGSMDADPSASLVKSLSTPDINGEYAEMTSPSPVDPALMKLRAEHKRVFSERLSNSVPASPQTHEIIRQLFEQYQGYRLAGEEESYSSSTAAHTPGISLGEALDDPSIIVTATGAQIIHRRPSRALSADLNVQLASISAGSAANRSQESRDRSSGKYSTLPFSPSLSAVSARGSVSALTVLTRKNKKDKNRRGSRIFGIGGSKSKKSKEEIKKCQQSHSFVSVSFSNTTPCQICGKPLAHKSASQCQNCLLTCHDSSCLEQIDACPVGESSRWNKNGEVNLSGTGRSMRTGSVNSSGSNGNSAVSPATGANGTGTNANLPSVFVEKMISEHGYSPNNVSDAAYLGLVDPKMAAQPLKRLSVPSSFEAQSTSLSGTQSESSLSGSSPGSSRRPVSPGSFSRWKNVADKLLNKPCTTDTHADSDSDDLGGASLSESVGTVSSSTTVTADVKDVLPYARLLEFDPELKLATPEPEAWSMMQDKEFLSTLSEKEVKRQDIIHELIQTEKNHCAVLLIIDQIYIRGLRNELQWADSEIEKFFPSFSDILDVHVKFFRQLRARQQLSRVVDSIGDVLLDQFDGERGYRMKRAYGAFCSHHKEAGQIYKSKLQKDRRFAAFDAKCVDKLKCHSSRFDIPSCILLVTQRISKYRLLIESIFHKTDPESADKTPVSRAFECVKDVLSAVDAAIGMEDRRKRLNEIYRAMDSKSSTLINGQEWKKHQLFDRDLIYDGPVQFRRNNGKLVDIQALLLADCIVFLQENNQKFSFAHTDDKPAVVPLNRVLIRPKAERSGIPEKSLFLISSGLPITAGTAAPPYSSGSYARAEMYEMICTNVRECEKWRNLIENACTTLRRVEEARNAPVDVDLAVDDTVLRKVRQIIGTLQAKDKAISALCEEKCDSIRDTADSLEIPRWQMNFSPPFSQEITEENFGADQIKNVMQLALTEVNRLIALTSTCDTSAQQRSTTVISPPPLPPGNLPLPSQGNMEPPTSPGPKRAETFGGFDGNKELIASVASTANRSTSMKDGRRYNRPINILTGSSKIDKKGDTTSGVGSSTISTWPSRDSSTGDYSSSSAISSSPSSSPRMSALIAEETLPPLIYGATVFPSLLQLHWYLTQSVDGIARQFTAFESLGLKHAAAQQRLASMDQRDRKLNKHTVQLEELRSLQETFTKEKNQYMTERENENQWIKQKRQEIDRDANKLRAEKEDMEKQRAAMFAQCEKLRESGLDVVLSSNAPFVQIFPRNVASPPQSSSTPYSSSVSLVPALPTLPESQRSAPVLPSMATLPPPSSGRPLPPRPPLASSHSLNQIRLPGVVMPNPALPPIPSESPVGNRLKPPAPPEQPKQIIPTSLAGNWKGSMESLNKKAEAAKEKFRNFCDGHGQDKTDSLPRPRHAVRAASEAKLGISNLMHLSEKTNAINGASSAGSLSGEKESKKKSGDKKRSFL